MTRADFNNLVNRISRNLYIQAFHILRNQAGSEDAVQEVFLKLWNMNSKLAEYKSIEALTTTMIKNYCIDQIRKKKLLEPADRTDYLVHLDSEPSPLEKMEKIETGYLINRIINDLPIIFHEIIQFRDIDGLSYEEIAELTGQNINTLRVNLSRARKMVREEYKKYYYEH